MTSLHKVRQVRRLESYARNLSHYTTGVSQPYQLAQIASEWKAILRAKGYGKNFHSWALLNVTPMWLVSPYTTGAMPWIAALTKAVKTDCADYLRFAKGERLRDFRNKLQVDWKKNGGKFTCCLLRKPAHPPVNQLTPLHEVPALLLRSPSKGKPKLRLQHQAAIQTGDAVTVNGHATFVLSRADLNLEVGSLPQQCPSQCTVN